MDLSTFLSKYANHPNYKSPTGSNLNTKSWLTEAPLRMFLNNLDAEVAEDPDSLVVYGGTGQAARDRKSVEKIIEVHLTSEENSEFRNSVEAVAGLLDACKGIDKSLQ